MKAASFIVSPPYSAGTVHSRRLALARVLTHLARPDLARAVPRTPAPAPRQRVAVGSEVERILAAAEPHLRLWVLLCHDAALRSATATNLMPADYDTTTQTITTRTKRQRVARIPATARLAQALADVHAKAILLGTTLVGAARLRPVGNTQLHNHFRQLCESLGIVGLKPHDLRRTVANRMLKTFADLQAVQTLLAHQSLRSTFRYLDRPALITAAMIDEATANTTPTNEPQAPAHRALLHFPKGHIQ